MRIEESILGICLIFRTIRFSALIPLNNYNLNICDRLSFKLMPTLKAKGFSAKIAASAIFAYPTIYKVKAQTVKSST